MPLLGTGVLLVVVVLLRLIPYTRLTYNLVIDTLYTVATILAVAKAEIVTYAHRL
ncbi:hypothetical protein GMORB2_4749 [Geosmithia morbida]|uniref:Uncharacterized protein n=1 Tax=Geosmithia morbida TaxID=1094350 RepID=A0A9P4YPM6_9HYPO|nr:uncharacterized protein GMORB2_4749 [Geosmithia morbida]KAF4119484.1 hypothetical protein GMORB2_4749 [Geosmithia morbida]